MADVELVATQFAGGLQTTLRRVASLVLGVAYVGIAVGTATYLTGLWALDGSARSSWVVLGAVLCAIPGAAALLGWLLVRSTARHAPLVVDEVRSLLSESPGNIALVIDHDSGQPVATAARSFGGLRTAMATSTRRLPSLTRAIRAVTKVPLLAAASVLTTLAVGLVGTVLLIGKLL